MEQVQSRNGQEGLAPAIVFLIPPPDKTAVGAASRLGIHIKHAHTHTHAHTHRNPRTPVNVALTFFGVN